MINIFGKQGCGAEAKLFEPAQMPGNLWHGDDDNDDDLDDQDNDDDDDDGNLWHGQLCGNQHDDYFGDRDYNDDYNDDYDDDAWSSMTRLTL